MERFADSPVGQLVPVEVPVGDEMVRQLAFVPSPLPDELTLSQATWSAAMNAAVELGQLAGITRSLQVEPRLLAGLTVRREALSTSALEGTYAPVVDVLASEASPLSPRTTAITEVLNFVHAADHGVRRLAELPVCVRLACELHAILVEGTPSEDYQKGQVRETQVAVGASVTVPPAERLRNARFVPPPPGRVLIDGLSQWERWSNTASMHPLMRVAVSHCQFETLHPFTDGNGRIGRLLAILQLIEAGILDTPVVNLSPYFEARRDQYIGLLEQVSATGAWDEWVAFFCDALASQAADGVRRIRELLDWRDSTLARLRDAGVRGTAHNVIDQLISQPMTTARAISDHHGVSASAANHALRRLLETGIVQEITGKPYARVYAATDVLALLHRPSS
ncbi:MAG: Fic family protein [Acidimicrobiaceae bacterium]|nr:Fic family protein [Acidimicrobiaceae bacterium]